MSIGEPLCHLTDNTSLRFHLLSVGEGLMHLLIFPDETTMLFDCNVTNDNETEILDYLEKCIPSRYNADKDENEQNIDIFVNSHRDEDHYRGLKKVNDKFKINSIWDSGQSGATTASSDYQYYMRLKRKLKETGNSHELTPSDIPIEISGVKIFCLSSERDYTIGYVNEAKFSAAKDQHTNSIVLMLEYSNRKILLTGDSDWKSWKESIVPNFNNDDFLKTDILIASHHGSRSFFTDEANNEHIDEEENPDTTYIESIKYISPTITLISCGKYSSASHPNVEAEKIYENHTSLKQVYTTNKLGHICGFVDRNGYFTVIPYRFHDRRNTSKYDFKIKCIGVKDGIRKELNRGDSFEVGAKLYFSIIPIGGIIEPIEKTKDIWEVSNCSIDHDCIHHEIYYKGKEEKDGILNFSRDLQYKGRHFLRCRINNNQKGISVTRIFWINGLE